MEERCPGGGGKGDQPRPMALDRHAMKPALRLCRVLELRYNGERTTPDIDTNMEKRST